MTNQEIQQALDHFLGTYGLKEVLSIDDMYGERFSEADFRALFEALELDIAESVLGEDSGVDLHTDKEIRDEQLRKFWDRLPPDRQTSIIDELRAKSSSRDDTDLIAKESLAQLFANQKFRGLSLRDWEEEKKTVLSTETPMLILVDEDFSKEGLGRTAGRAVVKEILQNSEPNKIMCGLVSHNYPPQNVHDAREQLCQEEGFDRSRFVLIPKALADDDLTGFASLIKLAVIAKPMDQLREKVTAILDDSLKQAKVHVSRISIYDMEEIVFQSSLKEGIWEPETLVRVFNLFLRMEARPRIFSNRELHEISAKIRQISEIKTKSPRQPAHKIWPIQHAEIFDEPEIVNGLRLPLAIGDIFERANRRYILIYPPCDLAVRSGGEREGGVREAVIAEIVPNERKNGSWELRHFVQNKKLFVDFKRTHTVKLAVLDLCVYNEDGRAIMRLNQAAPVGMVPSWQKRYGLLQRDIQKLVAIYNRIAPSLQQRDEVVRAIFKCSNEGVFIPWYDADSSVLEFDFKRTHRLSQPRASLLLQKYADFLTREALDQELETPLPPTEDPASTAAPDETQGSRNVE